MLIQFAVENFLSFKDEAVLNLIATKDTTHTEHLVSEKGTSKLAILPLAAIYGANASGKSNFIEALAFAQSLIVKGTRGEQFISLTPFKLNSTNPHNSSRFDFTIKYKDVTYNYGFVIKSSVVVEEWLFATLKRTEVKYFERTTSDSGKIHVEFGSSFSDKKTKKQKQFYDFVAQGTRKNQLFLTEAGERNILKVAPLLEWFKHVLTIIPAESKYGGLEIKTNSDDAFNSYIGSFLATAGTGISGVSANEESLDFEKSFPDFPPELKESIISSVNDQEDKPLIINISGKQGVLRKANGKILLMTLKTRHATEGGSFINFDISEESEGTQRLLHLIPALYALKTEEKVIVIDELDRRLHPSLTKMIVENALLHRNGSTKSGQLIFSTHETNLLDLEMLRRDEVWLVEKDNGGASHLYSLADFKIRPDLRLQKGYLSGRFGAIPFIGDLSKLGWASEEEKNGTHI